MSSSTAETGRLRRQPRWRSRALGAGSREQRLGRLLGELRLGDADLIVLALLLALTAAFGRAFSILGVADTVFVSEVLLVAVIALLLLRLGLPAAWRELRARLPLPLLGAFWILGAVAAVRGLDAFGLSLVTEDIGLVEYSVLLPLVALVALDRRRLELLGGALLIGAAGALIVFLADSVALRAGLGGLPISLPASGPGMAISFLVIWIAARAIAGLEVPRWQLAVAGLGLLLMWATDQRSVWLAVLLAAVALVALAPRDRLRAAAAAVGGAVVASFAVYLALGAAFSIPPHEIAPGDDRSRSQPLRELGGLRSGAGEEGANVEWRLAYWGELTSRTVSDPQTAAIGVGFGEPAAFEWRGHKFDFRDGDPFAQMDVGGPHNSFVSIMYRMGIPALLAVLALLAVAIRRAAPLLRERRLPPERRVELITIFAALLVTIAIAGFNEALKGPFLGMFFWVALALLFVYPVIEREGGRGSSTGPRGAPERTSSVAAS